MNFPDIMSATCDTRLPIPLSTFGIDFWNRLLESTFGIDLTLPLQWPDTSLGTLHLLLEPQLYPTSICVGQIVKSSISVSVSKMPVS